MSSLARLPRWFRPCIVLQTRAIALMCTASSSSVAIVALFGAGSVECARHAQFAIDNSLAGLSVALAAAVRHAPMAAR